MMSHPDGRQPPLLPSGLVEDVLDLAIEEILGRDNPYSYSMLTAIERFLRQFRLSSRVEAYEVLAEAYLRGKKLMQTGQVIENPHAWLRSTSFNIVRERSRKLKHQPIDPHLVASLVSDAQENPISLQILREDIDALRLALQRLKAEEPEGAELLYLRTVEEWSWQQIREWLIQQNREAPNEVTLRQRASRAKKRLRRIFHTVIA